MNLTIVKILIPTFVSFIWKSDMLQLEIDLGFFGSWFDVLGRGRNCCVYADRAGSSTRSDWDEETPPDPPHVCRTAFLWANESVWKGVPQCPKGETNPMTKGVCRHLESFGGPFAAHWKEFFFFFTLKWNLLYRQVSLRAPCFCAVFWKAHNK